MQKAASLQWQVAKVSNTHKHMPSSQHWVRKSVMATSANEVTLSNHKCPMLESLKDYLKNESMSALTFTYSVSWGNVLANLKSSHYTFYTQLQNLEDGLMCWMWQDRFLNVQKQNFRMSATSITLQMLKKINILECLQHL